MSHQDLVSHMNIGEMEKISVTFLSESNLSLLSQTTSIKKIHQIEVFLYRP